MFLWMELWTCGVLQSYGLLSHCHLMLHIEENILKLWIFQRMKGVVHKFVTQNITFSK